MRSTYRLEQHIPDQMPVAQFPGLALAVVQGQEVVYTHGFGVTGIEAKTAGWWSRRERS